MTYKSGSHTAGQERHPSGSGHTWRAMSKGFAFIFFTILLVSCGRDSPAPGADVTAGRIIENPTDYVGRTLTVSGEIEDILGSRAFTIDSGLNAGDLLVVGREPFPQVTDGAAGRAFLVDDTVTVTGTVRALVTAEVERELGWDLSPQLEVEFEGRPVLVAQNARFTAGARGDRGTATPAASPTISPTATPAPAAAGAGGAEVPAQVNDFINHVRGCGPEQMGPEHECTAVGLRRLSDALAAVIERDGSEDGDIRQRREALRQQADRIQRHRRSTQHADIIREAFTSAADLMATIQQRRYPNLGDQVAQVRSAAEAIDPNQLTLNQRERIHQFFARAGEALENMARARG